MVLSFKKSQNRKLNAAFAIRTVADFLEETQLSLAEEIFYGQDAATAHQVINVAHSNKKSVTSELVESRYRMVPNILSFTSLDFLLRDRPIRLDYNNHTLNEVGYKQKLIDVFNNNSDEELRYIQTSSIIKVQL